MGEGDRDVSGRVGRAGTREGRGHTGEVFPDRGSRDRFTGPAVGHMEGHGRADPRRRRPGQTEQVGEVEVVERPQDFVARGELKLAAADVGRCVVDRVAPRFVVRRAAFDVRPDLGDVEVVQRARPPCIEFQTGCKGRVAQRRGRVSSFCRNPFVAAVFLDVARVRSFRFSRFERLGFGRDRPFVEGLRRALDAQLNGDGSCLGGCAREAQECERTCQKAQETTSCMHEPPLSTRASGFRSEVGLLAPGPIPPRLPIPHWAEQWLRAQATRGGGLPRLQWRVRAGFTPASLATDPVLWPRVYPMTPRTGQTPRRRADHSCEAPSTARLSRPRRPSQADSAAFSQAVAGASASPRSR